MQEKRDKVKIVCLVENTSKSETLLNEHGLSFYIETKHHHVLFDLGATGAVIDNAITLGIDLKRVDTVVISHGHIDHGGGLLAFLKINAHAKIYVHPNAFDIHVSKRHDAYVPIGLDESLMPHNQIVFTKNTTKIDDELLIFSDVKEETFKPLANQGLYKVDGKGNYQPDDFNHEQHLIVKDEGKQVLFTGCGHRGIINILNTAIYRKGMHPDIVIGGFHLSRHHGQIEEAVPVIKTIGTYLKETKSMYYTGHCTGINPYQHLKKIMQDTLHHIQTGDTITP
jgi:7,8-dihydropterin-6-yl-methyl-4-(beta-D-ribofuranosyl)aminobenzene 5'-phosphate synthase